MLGAAVFILGMMARVPLPLLSLFAWGSIIMGIVRSCQRRRTAWFYWCGLLGLLAAMFVSALLMTLTRRP